MGQRLGDPADPLLVSVRSGRQVLDARHDGDRPQHRPQRRQRGRARRAGRRRRAVRLGLLPPADPDVRQDRLRRARRGVRARARRGQARPRAPPTTSTSTPTTCAALVDAYKKIFAEHTGRDFPQDPREQLDLAIRAVFDSWNADRAVLYRRQERIPADLGTAVNVVAMVFGNLGADSGTGVAFTRDPATGAQRRLRRLPGQRPGRGRGRRHPQHRAAAGAGAARPGAASTSCSASWPRWRSTTATCATSSSPSSAASCGCCRPGSASAPPRPRSSSPPSSSTRA